MTEKKYTIADLPLLQFKMKELLEEFGNILLFLEINRNVLTIEQKIKLMTRKESNHLLRRKLLASINKVQRDETVTLSIDEFNIDEKLFEGGDNNVKYQRK